MASFRFLLSAATQRVSLYAVAPVGRYKLAVPFERALTRLIPALLALCLQAGFVFAQQPVRDRVVQLDIPRQQADGALTALGQQADITVLYRYDVVRSYRTNVVSGQYRLAIAVAELLKNTRLKAEFAPSGHLIVTRMEEDEQVIMVRKEPKKTVLAAVVSALFGAAAAGQVWGQAGASAQTDGVKSADALLEEVIVIGVRSSVQAAQDAKRNAEFISDSYFAEDIGKSSDESIAEALQRIPGVTITRGDETGDAGTVTVRGIEPALNDIKLNGISLTSSTDDQAVDLNIFSADILSRIDVVKSPSANQEEGSLGGLVNLYTTAPFDKDRDSIVFGLEARYNDLTSEKTPRATFSFSKRFSDKIGIAGSFFFDDNELRRDVYETFVGSFSDVRNGPIDAATGQPVDLSGLGLPNDVRDPNGDGVDDVAALADGFQNYRLFLQDEKKSGGTTTLQFRPDDVTDIRVDLSYSKQNEDLAMWENRGIQASFIPGDLADQPNGSSTVDLKTGRVLSYFSPVLPTLSQVREQFGDTENLVFSGNFTREIDAWTINALAGYSSTQQKIFWETINTRPEANVRDASGASPCGFEMRPGRNGVILPVFIGCERFDIERAGGQFIESGSQFEREVEDKKYSLYLDFSRELDFAGLTSADFGIKYTDRSKNRFSAESFYNNAALGLPTPEITGLDIRRTPGGFLAGIAPPGVSDSWVYATINSLRNAVFPNGMPPGLTARNPAEQWEVNEETYGFYIQGNFDFMDGRVSGDAGLRYANTKVNTIGNSGFQFSTEYINPNTGENYPDSVAFPGSKDSKSYGEILPSLNIRINMQEDLLLRLSAARVMARPNLNNLAPGFLVTDRDAGRPPTASGGNTQLDPFIADQFDGAVEWYFQHTGFLSATLFYKNIGSFTYASSDQRSFPNPVTGEDCLANRAAAPLARRNTATVAEFGCAGVIYNTQINGAKGEITGLELVYNQVYDFLPGALQYSGMALNYTYADSDTLVDPTDAANPTNGLPFLNTSKNSLNSTLFWDNGSFSMRLAYSWRDKALVTVRDVNSSVFRDTRGVLDFSANWQVTEKLLISFQGINLTNTYDRLFEAIAFAPGDSAPFIKKEISRNIRSIPDGRTYRLNHQGRSYRLGVRYSF